MHLNDTLLLLHDNSPTPSLPPEVEGFLQAVSVQLHDSQPQRCVDYQGVMGCLLPPMMEVLAEHTAKQGHHTSGSP